MASSASEDHGTLPVIGITSYLEQARTGVWDVPASFLPASYLDAITETGGLALVLPPQPASRGAALALLGRLDGLVLAGGADIGPERYGATPHPATGAPRTDRDGFELDLAHAAIELGLPLLGICRGAQLLNVALGGTLHQHLPDLIGSKKYQPAPAVFGSEPVRTEPGSMLASILGERANVPVYHHQAIDRLADGLRVTARSEDGIVEAVELPGPSFTLAVQWHPEEDRGDRRIFAALVRAAREHRKAPPASAPEPEPAA